MTTISFRSPPLALSLLAVLAAAAPAAADDAAAAWKRDGDVITGAVAVESPEQLKQLEGVKTIRGSLSITGSKITDLKPLHALTQVTGDTANLVILGTDIASVEGLESLGWVNGVLSIDSNRKLASLAALTSVQTIGESFTITGNGALTALPVKGFRIGEPTRHKTGWLTVSKNATLPQASVDALAKKCVVGKTTLDHNAK